MISEPFGRGTTHQRVFYVMFGSSFHAKPILDRTVSTVSSSQTHSRETLDYQTTLEKAVLEYATYASAHPKTRSSGSTQIPGFQDPHVWGMASQLSGKEFIRTTLVGDKGAVCVESITEKGADRLKEIEKQAEQEMQAEKARYAEAAQKAKANKKWWKFGRS